MKLYEIPNKSYFKIVDDGDIGNEDLYKLHHLDGMYSYCTNKKKEVVHIFIGTEVEIVKQPKDLF